jgi:hypothetical protein
MFGVRLSDVPMTPRPLHRWKSFWLGVFILVFLGWAWARSLHHLEGFLWMAPRFHFSAAETTGRVEVAWAGSSGAWGKDFLWVHEAAATTGEPLFPKAVNWESYPGQIQLTVAHWFLMLLLLLPWSTFLGWRYRRIRRMARHHANSLSGVL